MRIRDWSSDLCSSDLALVLVELVDQVVDDALVEVLAAEEGVAVGRQHLELLLAVDVGDLDDRHVEGAAAQVVHGDLAVAAVLVQAIGQRGRGRLVDDALDVQAGDLARVLGRLALGVVAVRSEEQKSDIQSLMRISYAVIGLSKK